MGGRAMQMGGPLSACVMVRVMVVVRVVVVVVRVVMMMVLVFAHPLRFGSSENGEGDEDGNESKGQFHSWGWTAVAVVV
jgi:hypothetical protein